MSRTALYEEGSTGDNIRLRSYCGPESRRFSVRTAFTGVFIYLLAAAVVFIAAEADLSLLKDRPILITLLTAAAVLVGALFTFLYVKAVKKVISSRYRNVRSSMVGYDLQKKKLRQIVQEGKTETVSAE